MKTRFALLVSAALALMSQSAFAQVGAPAAHEPNPLAYMQSCGLGPTYGITTSGSIGDAKQFKQTGVANGDWSGVNQVFEYGLQYLVSVNGDGAVLVCQHHTASATISLGLSNTGGDGLGRTTFDSANTPSGQAPCIFLESGSRDVIKISPSRLRWNRGMALADRSPLSRPGQCTTVGTETNSDPAVGGGCSANADCGAAGVCDLTLKPKGVYISAIGLAASTEVKLTECVQ